MIDVDELEEMLRNRIAQLRLLKGVSARDMSLSIGQGAAYINNIENGKTMPSMRGFLYICDYLNVSPKDFFDFNAADPEKLNDVIANLKFLSPEHLSSILTIVKGLRR